MASVCPSFWMRGRIFMVRCDLSGHEGLLKVFQTLFFKRDHLLWWDLKLPIVLFATL